MAVEHHQDVGPAQVGARMRRFRKAANLALRELSSSSGLSIGFLSQVERGISSIGLTALGSVATALGKPVGDFFDDAPGVGDDRVVPLPMHFTLTRTEGQRTQFESGSQTYRMLSDRAAGWCWSRCSSRLPQEVCVRAPMVIQGRSSPT